MPMLAEQILFEILLVTQMRRCQSLGPLQRTGTGAPCRQSFLSPLAVLLSPQWATPVPAWDPQPQRISPSHGVVSYFMVC